MISAVGKPMLLLSALFLFAFGFAVCHLYGRYAFMPLDNSIVFDGAWRVESGQVPFRDFSLSTGLTPLYMQWVFFKIAGVNFGSYLAHASACNGAFAVLVFLALIRIRLTLALSAFYAAASAVIFYPAIGWPSIDHHSFFFLTLSMWFFFFLRQESWWRSLLGLASLALAFLSKQSPAVFGIALLVPVYALSSRENLVARCKTLLVSAMALGLGAGLLLWVSGIPFASVADDLWLKPAALGTRRFSAGWVQFGMSIFGVFKIVDFSLWSYLSAGAVTVLIGIDNFKRLKEREVREPLILAAVCYAICGLYIMTVNNQLEIGLGLLFLASGLVNATVFLIFERRAAIVLSAFLVLATCGDVIRFHRMINETRMVADLTGKTLADMPAAGVPDSMRPLHWALPDHYALSAGEFGTLVAKLQAAPGNFLLFGDFSVLYGLTDKPSLFPALYFDPLMIPTTDSSEMLQFEAQLRGNIERYRVKTIVLEGQKTFVGTPVGHFPRTYLWLKENTCQEENLGFYRILTLCR